MGSSLIPKKMVFSLKIFKTKAAAEMQEGTILSFNKGFNFTQTDMQTHGQG